MPKKKTTKKKVAKVTKKKAARRTTSAVTTTTNRTGEVAIPDDLAEELLAASGQTQANVGQRDIVFPFISVLQELSPQCKTSRDEYIEGAEAGMFFNTATKELFDELIIVPCEFLPRWVEWKSRKAGGGLVKQYGADEALPVEVGGREIKAIIPVDGMDEDVCNELKYTHYHYVLVIDPKTGEASQAILGLTMTMIKESSSLNNLLLATKIVVGDQKICPPRYMSVVKCTTKSKSNPQGDWSVWDFERYRLLDLTKNIDREVYQAGKLFADLVNTGALDISASVQAAAVVSDAPEAPAPENEPLPAAGDAEVF